MGIYSQRIQKDLVSLMLKVQWVQAQEYLKQNHAYATPVNPNHISEGHTDL